MADVFISYSRKDIAFARLLNEALGESQLETWIDWARIPVGEKWWDEICAAIEQAGIFLFIISRNSVGSPVCKNEVSQALSHNKRVIPVIVDDTPEAAIREFVPDLTAINWIIFRQDDVFQIEARPGENLPPEEQAAALAREPQFQQALDKLNAAIHTDWAWVKAQSRLEMRAREWERHDREASRLLRGKDLGEAEQWLSQVNARYDPQPTDVQRRYVLAGRWAESRRQRLTLWASLGAAGVVSICLVIAIVLGGLAWQAQQTAQSEANARATEVIARSTAEANALSAKATAEVNLAHSERLRLAADAEAQLAQPDGNVETAALLSLRALRGEYVPQADASLQKSLPGLYATRTLSGHTGEVNSVAFSPDGKWLLTGSDDKTARLWDAATGAEVRTFSGHTDQVWDVAFSPDGKEVLTGSADGTAKLWDAATGAEVRTFSGNKNGVWTVAF
jgi:ribosomal protein L22